MEKQVILSIGREFGSGGHEIAQNLAEHYGLTLYDQNLLEHVVKTNDPNGRELLSLDERKKSYLFTRTVKGMTSSVAENLANLQFDFLRKRAEEGDSFVVVGRCAEHVLKDCPGLISLFILGDRAVKCERIQGLYHLSQEKAISLMEESDRSRKRYHNSHCDIKWGDSRGYDLSVNSSKLGIQGTVEILCQYIDARIEQMQNPR